MCRIWQCRAFQAAGLTLGLATPLARQAPLLRRVESGEIDPSFVITHKVPIDKGPEMYKTFRDKEDGCIKVVLKPWE
jgi:threonine dehydrogenase-like Zn-dependent dehydrogenase